MHFRGFVIVPEATNEAVAKAMAKFAGKHWDWYRPGGRFDGYFQGEEEMQKRATHSGFNFEPTNEIAAHNAIKAKDLTEEHSCYFFVAEGKWYEKEYYDDNKPNPLAPSLGSMVENKSFKTTLIRVLAKHPDHYVVVVDVHN